MKIEFIIFAAILGLAAYQDMKKGEINKESALLFALFAVFLLVKEHNIFAISFSLLIFSLFYIFYYFGYFGGADIIAISVLSLLFFSFSLVKDFFYVIIFSLGLSSLEIIYKMYKKEEISTKKDAAYIITSIVLSAALANYLYSLEKNAFYVFAMFLVSFAIATNILFLGKIKKVFAKKMPIEEVEEYSIIAFDFHNDNEIKTMRKVLGIRGFIIEKDKQIFRKKGISSLYVYCCLPKYLVHLFVSYLVYLVVTGKLLFG